MYVPWIGPRSIQIYALVGGISLHDGAFTAVGRGVRVLRFLDLLDKEIKGLAHANVIAGTSFGPGARMLLSELLAGFGGDLTLLGTQVTLISYDADRNLVNALQGWILSHGQQWGPWRFLGPGVPPEKRGSERGL